MGQRLNETIEPTESAVGLRQQDGKIGVDLDGRLWWQWLGSEGAVSGWLTDASSCPKAICGLRKRWFCHLPAAPSGG